METTICVLLFGDYVELAKRCLSAIFAVVPKNHRYHVRVAMNAVSTTTRDYVQSLIVAGELHDQQMFWADENIHKYPMMRRMIHGRMRVDTPYLMWFDDDSYITQQSPEWLQLVEQRMAHADMLGSAHTYWFQGNQKQWVTDQPWYAGRSWPTDQHGREQLPFCTGGWWTVRTSLLYKYNWPWPELDHRGGDVMLGQLLYQQRLDRQTFGRGIAINADAHGKSHASQRRGFDSKPIGYYYKRQATPAGPSRREQRLSLDL